MNDERELLDTFGSHSDATGARLAASLLARWTVLLALAWVSHAALGRRNPRWKVALWRAVPIGAILLPIFSWVPPVARWPIADGDLPKALNRLDETRIIAATSDPGINAPARLFDEMRSSERPSRSLQKSGRETSTETAASTDFPGRAVGEPGVGQSVRTEVPLRAFRIRLSFCVLGVWITGVGILAFRYLRQARHLDDIIRRSERVTNKAVAEWTDLAGQSAARPSVDVRRSAEVHSPCLARAWRPVLLLPERGGSEHDPGEIRAVFAHELAHARNHDLAWNDVLHLVSMLLWFHPLVWRVRETHALACDAVCDAEAASELGDVASYSRALARLALRATGAPLAGGLAMARIAHVRRRIDALNRRVFRSRLPRRLTVPATLVFALCVIMIGGLGFTRGNQPARAHGSDATAGNQPVPTKSEQPPPTAPAAGPQDKEIAAGLAVRLSASGTVVDTGGIAVAGATVILREWSVYRVREMTTKETERLIQGEELQDTLAETKTDPSGRFRFDGIRAPVFPQVPQAGKNVFPWDLVAVAPRMDWPGCSSHPSISDRPSRLLSARKERCAVGLPSQVVGRLQTRKSRSLASIHWAGPSTVAWGRRTGST